MKLLISNSISTDGFICGPDSYEDWISDADFEYFKNECEAADIIILGGNTYNENGSLFPVVEKEHVVFTKSAKNREPKKYITFSAADPIEFCKENSDKQILVAGGGLLNGSLLKAGIVTDITVCVHPIILGSGIRQFEKIDFNNKTNLKKVSEKDIGDDVVQIHYKVI